mgnify:FL=1
MYNIMEIKNMISANVDFENLYYLDDQTYIDKLLMKIFGKSIYSNKLLYERALAVAEIIKNEKQYELDIAFNENNECFYALLSYLNRNGFIDESEVMVELFVPMSEFKELYESQKEIGYFYLLDDDSKRTYFIGARGITALNNLMAERNKEGKIKQNYNKYKNKVIGIKNA